MWYLSSATLYIIVASFSVTSPEIMIGEQPSAGMAGLKSQLKPDSTATDATSGVPNGVTDSKDQPKEETDDVQKGET